MRRDDSSPEAYRNDVTGTQSELLEAVGGLIFEVAPEAEEVVEYGVLGYPGVANLAAQKHYVALYVTPAACAKHRNRLQEVVCGKSYLRFRSADQIDPDSLRDLLRDVIEARSE